MELSSFTIGDKLSIARMKVEVACLYYIQLPKEKRSKGKYFYSGSELFLVSVCLSS